MRKIAQRIAQLLTALLILALPGSVEAQTPSGVGVAIVVPDSSPVDTTVLRAVVTQKLVGAKIDVVPDSVWHADQTVPVVVLLINTNPADGDSLTFSVIAAAQHMGPFGPKVLNGGLSPRKTIDASVRGAVLESISQLVRDFHAMMPSVGGSIRARNHVASRDSASRP